MKSEIVRLLNKEDVIISDALNYIKGYRYELYCVCKSARATHCLVNTAINPTLALEYNKTTEKPYTEEIMNGLAMRYEEPQHNNRWDSPLFMSHPDEPLDFEAIEEAIFGNRIVKPNQSTQNVSNSFKKNNENEFTKLVQF
jgi:protein KTI12